MNAPFAHWLPRPREARSLPGAFSWARPAALVLEPGNECDRFAAEWLARACRAAGLSSPAIRFEAETPKAPAPKPKGPAIVLGDPCRHFALFERMRRHGLEIPPDLGDEGYLLRVGEDEILVAANTTTGVYYGVQTLIQSLPEGDARETPSALVVDRPALRMRGISMDLARGEVYTPEAIEREIERLAHCKLNTLLLYIEDAFLFPSRPEIGDARDRLTPDDARALDAFARRHHVLLIPCLDSPGHLERLLARADYAHLREGNATPAQRMVIDVTHPDTYPLMNDLYNDICDAFSSPIVHVGADECVALGQGASRPMAEAVGADRLFLRHLKVVREILARRGRRPMAWSDMFEPGFFAAFGIGNYGAEALRWLPRDTIVNSWHYNVVEEFPFGDTARAMGFDLVVQTAMGSTEIFPTVGDAARNVESFLPHATRLGALGALHSNWGDVISFREYNWPAIAHFAEWAWSAAPRPWAEALPVAVARFFGAGAEPLARAYRFLGDTPRYFGWSILGLGFPGLKMFFDPVEPLELEGERLTLFEQFRAEGREARAAFEAARESVVRHRDWLDYFAFALDQFETLGDLVECRHRMARATKARETGDELGALLDKIARALPRLLERYEMLWHRARMPKGLEPNRATFLELMESVRAARTTHADNEKKAK